MFNIYVKKDIILPKEPNDVARNATKSLEKGMNFFKTLVSKFLYCTYEVKILCLMQNNQLSQDLTIISNLTLPTSLRWIFDKFRLFMY